MVEIEEEVVDLSSEEDVEIEEPRVTQALKPTQLDVADLSSGKQEMSFLPSSKKLSQSYASPSMSLEDFFAADPALRDQDLERKLAENDAIGGPKLLAAREGFRRAAELADVGDCIWLDSEDDSEDDNEEKEWKLAHPNYNEDLSSDDENEP